MSVQVGIAKGDLVWRNVENREDFLPDNLNMLMFSMKVETGRLRFMRPYLHAGYQQMSDLVFLDVSDSDFSGFFFGAGIRLGYFNQ